MSCGRRGDAGLHPNRSGQGGRAGWVAQWEAVNLGKERVEWLKGGGDASTKFSLCVTVSCSGNDT